MLDVDLLTSCSVVGVVAVFSFCNRELLYTTLRSDQSAQSVQDSMVLSDLQYNAAVAALTPLARDESRFLMPLSPRGLEL